MKNRRILSILIITLAVTMIALFRQCTITANARNEVIRNTEIAAQNQRALIGKIQIEKTKNGFTEAVRLSYIAKVDELAAMNEQLYNELKDTKAKVVSIITTNTIVEMQPVTLDNALIDYPDSATHGIAFHHFQSDAGASWEINGESKFRLANGRLSAGETTISKNSISVKLTMGFKETKEGYEVFARSKSPTVTIGELDGVMIIPKKADLNQPIDRKKRIVASVGGGYGIGLDLKPRPILAATLGFKLFEF